MENDFSNRLEKANRAKQFASFDAVKGLREALRQKERVIVSKVDLSEDQKVEIDRKLHQIKLNDIITIIYFNNGEYLKLTGMVSYFSSSSRTLQIINTRLNFDDIYDIQGEFDHFI